MSEKLKACVLSSHLLRSEAWKESFAIGAG
jgi:hypothetical protein